MATKDQMFNEINEILNEWSIKSVNGRHLTTNETYVNFAFKAKYNDLPYNYGSKLLQIIEDEDTIGSYSVLMNDFEEALKEFMDENYKYVAWIDDYTGFYGRSGGNFAITFQSCDLRALWSDNPYEVDAYTYKEMLQILRECRKLEKIAKHIRAWMIKWFCDMLDQII